MSYTRSTTVDPNPGGDTVKQAILDLDTDLTAAFTALDTFPNGLQIGSGTGTYKFDLRSTATGTAKGALTLTGLAHGMTTLAETTVYGLFCDAGVTGGTRFWGFSSDTTPGLDLIGVHSTTSDTVAPLKLRAGVKSGTTWTTISGTNKVLSIYNYATEVLTILGNGVVKLDHIAELTGSHNVVFDNTVGVDHIAEVTSAHGVAIDGVTLKDGGALVITGGTNTFNLTNGSAVLDIAAGSTVNVDANLTVESASLVNQDLTSDASPTFTTVKCSGLTDGYMPYHVSDAAGLGDSVFRTNGTQASILGTAPTNSYTLLVKPASNYTDYTSGIYQLASLAVPATTDSAARNFINIGNLTYPTVSTGGNNSGVVYGQLNMAMRNNLSAGTDDSGTLGNLRGLSVTYGHNNINVSATPSTGNVYGFYLSPYYITGTITGNIYDIFIAYPQTGGTLSGYHYSIYQQYASARNYFAGNVGIGTTTIDHALTITGSSTSGIKLTGETYNMTLIGNIESHPVTSTGGARIIAPANRNLHIEINGNAYDDRFSVITDPSGGATADTEVFLVSNLGCVSIGMPASSLSGTATNTLAIKNGTAPGAAITDVAQIYAADVGGVAAKTGVHMRSEAGGIMGFLPGIGTTNIYTYQTDSIADDASLALPDATSGIVFVSCNAEAGMWLVQNTGAVVKIAGSTNTAATDTDGSLCVLDGGTAANVKNRLGATGEIRVVYYYN